MIQHNNTDADDPVVKVLLKRLQLIQRFVQKRNVSVPKTVQAQLMGSGAEKLAQRTANRLRQVVSEVLPGTEHQPQIEYFAAARWPWTGPFSKFVRQLGQQYEDTFARKTLEPSCLCQERSTVVKPPRPVIRDLIRWLRWLGRQHARRNYTGKTALQELGFLRQGAPYPGTTQLDWTNSRVNVLQVEALHFGCWEAYRSPHYIRLPWSAAAQNVTREIAADFSPALKVWVNILAMPHYQQGAFRSGDNRDALHWSWRYHRRHIAPDPSTQVSRQPKKIKTAVDFLTDLNVGADALNGFEPVLSIVGKEPTSSDGTRAQAWLKLHEKIPNARRSLPLDVLWFHTPDHPVAHAPFKMLLFLLDRWSNSKRPNREIDVRAVDLLEAVVPATSPSRPQTSA